MHDEDESRFCSDDRLDTDGNRDHQDHDDGDDAAADDREERRH